MGACFPQMSQKSQMAAGLQILHIFIHPVLQRLPFATLCSDIMRRPDSYLEININPKHGW